MPARLSRRHDVMRENRPYHPNLYRFDRAQPSYWEATVPKSSLVATPLVDTHSCDVAIIGGGYTGLSAALHLARDFGIDVRVLEAGHLGWGASGRNGGFCGIGATGLALQDFTRRHGEEDARDFFQSQSQAVELVRTLATDEQLDIDVCGDAELDVAHTPKAFRRLQADHDLLTGTLGIDARIIGPDEFRERYFDSSEQFGALLTRPTFGLHPLRYCRGLAGAAARHGAVLHERSEVLEWTTNDQGGHRLRTAGGTLLANKVIFATNGFMPEKLRPEFYARSLPVVSAIVVTRPLTGDERELYRWSCAQPAINSRRVLNYFRMLPDNRFLFGGRGHTAGDPDGERQNYVELIATMQRLWPGWTNVDVDYRWHGLICFNRTLCPALGQLEDDASVFFGFGYHGNGVSTATWAGQQLANWIGKGRAPKLPAVVKGLSGRFPMAPLRLKYLRLSMAISSWLDRSG